MLLPHVTGDLRWRASKITQDNHWRGAAQATSKLWKMIVDSEVHWHFDWVDFDSPNFVEPAEIAISPGHTDMRVRWVLEARQVPERAIRKCGDIGMLFI